MLVDIEVDDPPAVMDEHDEDEEDAEACGGHGEEVDRDQVAHVVSQEGPPVLRGLGTTLWYEAGDGALGDVDADLEKFAVDARRTQKGLAAAIFLMRAAVSVSMRGRPRVGRRDSWVQYSRKRRRCQRRTVSGETMTSACRQPVQTLARPAQNRRSIVWSLSRGVVRL